MEAPKSSKMPSRIVRKTLNFSIYETLKSMILNGDLPPKHKLNETQIAMEMGTSTTPVREAFRMLAAEGLVQIEPWKGAVVQQYNVNDVKEVFQCRARLECLAMELLMEKLKADPKREGKLKKLKDMVEQSREERNVTKFVQINSAIHDFWIYGAGNQRLIGLMNSLNDALLHDRNVSGMDDKRRMEIVEEHMQIADAICRLDAEAAVAALQRHIDIGCRYSIMIREG